MAVLPPTQRWARKGLGLLLLLAALLALARLSEGKKLGGGAGRAAVPGRSGKGAG